jgi:dUTP pyrophosphatase
VNHPICQMPVVKIKKLRDNATIPTYSKPGDAGCDLYSSEEKVIWAGMYCGIHTGIAIELPKGYEAQVRPRSGMAAKHGITVINAPGTIDEGYRGEIIIPLINHSDEIYNIRVGDRIAQMIVSPVQQAVFQEVDELGDSERGVGGLGSTGK